MSTPNPKTQIVIADTQYLITESLKVILNDEKYSVAGVVDSAYALGKLLKLQKADVLITDFALLDYDGFEEIRQLRKDYPEMGILNLTNQLSKNEFTEFSKIGIKNIIYKTTDREELFAAIDATLKGKKFFTGEILDMLLELGERKNTLEEPTQLTNSEVEIVRLIAQGLTTKVIADKKNISFHTVMTHRKNIFRKLGINNASELLMYAIKSGLIDTIEYHI